jgi:hypothetical protein
MLKSIQASDAGSQYNGMCFHVTESDEAVVWIYSKELHMFCKVVRNICKCTVERRVSLIDVNRRESTFPSPAH